MKVNINHVVFTLGVFFVVPVIASENLTAASRSLVSAAGEEEPSLEFLIYLGEWQDNSGKSINPENYKDEKTVLASIKKNIETEKNFSKEKVIENQLNLENVDLNTEKKP